MKRLIAVAVTLLLVITPNAQAVPKKIVVNTLKLLASIGSPTEVSGVIVSSNNFIVFGTQNSRAYAKAVNSTGNELWKLQLDQSLGSIATAATVDAVGDIWIVGATPLATTPVSTPPIVINPDNAIIPPPSSTGDLKALTIWKVTNSGVLSSTNILPSNNVVLPTAVLADNLGLVVVGTLASEKISAGFMVSMSYTDIFSTVLQIGSASTSIESIARNSNGTFTLVGSSAETILGKKLVGITDGVIIKVSKSLKLTSVVRSSISKGKRSWSSTTSSLLLGGEVSVGAKNEVAVTKFSTRFLPTWTYRFAGIGPASTIGSTHLLFLSNGPISQLAWNPKISTPLLITFNAKGAITAADSVPIGQRMLLGTLLSTDLGPLIVTSTAETVSIFVGNSR